MVNKFAEALTAELAEASTRSDHIEAIHDSILAQLGVGLLSLPPFSLF